MKKLHSLIVGTYIGPFILTFFTVLFILIMQFLWLYIDELVGKGIEWYIIIELLFYASAHLVPMALPVAILLSSIMAFGNMGENYELVALKSSGMSLMRIMYPLIVVTVITAASAFYFANNVWPVANLKFKTLLYDIQHTKPAIDIKPGVFYKGIDGYVIRIADKDEDGQTMHDMLIYDHTKRQGANKVIRAEKGKMFMSEDKMFLNLVLYNGHSYDEVKDKEMQDNSHKPLIRAKFDKEIIRFNLSGFQLERTDEESFTSNYQMLNIVQLEKEMDTLKMKYIDRKAQVKKIQHLKFSLWRDTTITDSTTASKDSLKQYSILADLDESTGLRVVDMATNLTRSSKTQLTQFDKEFANRQSYINKYRMEWHRKFTIAFSCIVLFFIGAPLGAIIRKGGMGLPVIIAIIGFLVHYMLNIVGEKLVKEGTVAPFFGMWLSSLVLFPIALILSYKATTDSALFEGSTYVDVLRKFANFLRKLTKGKNTT
ncbi:MAG: LptF/LptG family permease [Flavobacteriales bacterium]|nr:LptF/LptG family permease [Flavobacteriales bacterium]